jgi:hypothetical protein
MTPSTLVRRAVAGVFVSAALSFPAHPVAAQNAQDMQTLANYRLTEPLLRQYYQAMTNLTKAIMKDTTLAAALESDGSSDDDNIANMAARYDRVPALKSALAGAGITSKEFATFSLSYIQAAMAYGVMSQGPENLRAKEVPKGTPKENVDFVRAHQELIQKLDKELKALLPPGSGD